MADFVPYGNTPPDSLIDAQRRRSGARYVDVNPRPSRGGPVLIYDMNAIFASIGNLFLCPAGGRDRIFQEDYFSGIYNLLQEPFDGITAESLNIAVHQALIIWEPRLRVTPSDIFTELVPQLPGYRVHVRLRNSTQEATRSYMLPIT